ncbi:hypothetical protein PVAG01_09567 [Phlyctema vagabunda]|uniref:Aminoglycoside phosphotransferase domain-containing protein n=1 Tax=Phlyctema vagabunda TaxID=108571 RepID=A0ABR4P7Q7_9HELO
MSTTIMTTTVDEQEQAKLLSATVDDFFLRTGLTVQDRVKCFAFVEALSPDEKIELTTCQGYCSMTLSVGQNTIIQFRPACYRLELSITRCAEQTYGPFVPSTRHIETLPGSELLVYRMSRIPGISYKTFRDNGASLEQRIRLCEGFASFLAKAWHTRNSDNVPYGKIGISIVSRLKCLIADLPARLQPNAKRILRELHHIEGLPWVLSHGDIVASNIMVEPTSGELTGMVDWAEAEYLPFGVCIYGLEEILGQITPRGFEYEDEAILREAFWGVLESKIPALKDRNLLRAVKLARDLGVLLWHGIAFDDGKIDRVVQEGKDMDEIHRLDAFLDVNPSEHTESKCKI